MVSPMPMVNAPTHASESVRRSLNRIICTIHRGERGEGGWWEGLCCKITHDDTVELPELSLAVLLRATTSMLLGLIGILIGL